jgi:hypothetical protein
MKTTAFSLFLCLIFMSGTCHAQIEGVKETNTPIALHYADILKNYIKFIKPKVATKEDLVKISKAYFDSLGYRLITIRIESAVQPKISKSWKIPNCKLAVLPRITCYLSSSGSNVELRDQGDDYVLIQNYDSQSGISGDPGLSISVGITHEWE